MKTQSYIPATAARRTPISKQKPKPVLLHQLLMLSIPLFAGIILAPLTTGCTSTPPPKEKPPGLTKAETLTESALKLSRAGNWQTAAEQWKEASGQFALLNDITNQAHALHNLGISRLRLKEFSKAESALAKAAELNSFINRRDRWWFNRIGLLQVYRESNNSIAQAASIESLQSQLQSVSDHEIRGHFFNEAALYEYSKQEFSKASELLDNAEKEFSGIDHIPGLAAVAANKARLLQSQAEHNRALEKWDAALRLSRETADYDGIASALYGKGKTLLELKQNLETSELLLEQAANNFGLLNMQQERTKAVHALIDCLQARNKVEKADAWRAEIKNSTSE